MKVKNISQLIAHLEEYKARYGEMSIEITDGYHGHDFEVYTEDRGGWDSPTRLLLRPFNMDGKQHTSGMLEINN